MIASLSGVLQAKGPDHAIVRVGGIGFKVFLPASSLAGLGALGDSVHLFTMLYVRQEQLALYGFASAGELELFELLLGVAGVGPKAALSVLSAAAPELLHRAVSTGNAELLERIPGIGKKTAGRIVVDLKGRLPMLAAGAIAGADSPDADVLAALVGLGYSASEAQSAVQSLTGDGSTLEERITQALRFLAKG